MRRGGESGFGLILLIMLIATAALFISGTALFLAESTRRTTLDMDRLKAGDLVQAGVYQALHDWWTSSGTETSRRYAPLSGTVSGTRKYRTGSQADFAYFMFNNPSNANWSNAGQRLRAWSITNIHTSIAGSADEITVARAIVSWSPAGPATLRLNRVRLNNNLVFNGSAVNGAEITLDQGSVNNRRLGPGSRWSGNNTRFEWNESMPDPVRVTVQWIFADDSTTQQSRTHAVVYWDGAQADESTATAARPSMHTFSVLCTGQVDASARLPKVLRTARATVSGNASGPRMEIIDWKKVEQNLT